MYNDVVRRLISELPNRGVLPEATHTSRAENPVCGDITQFQLRIEKNIILECRFQTQGCPGAIAAAAAVTLLCKRKTIDQCFQLSTEKILHYLGGLPPHRLHGVELAVQSLHEALL